MNLEFLINNEMIVDATKEVGVITDVVGDYIKVRHENRTDRKDTQYTIKALEDGRIKLISAEIQKKYELFKQNGEIISFLDNRNITKLVHFTNIKNIDSIKKYGLLSINKMNEMGIEYYANDKGRYDGYKDAICLSISRVNEPLFVQYFSKSNDEFVTLYIDASILYLENNKRIYCQTNAANSDKSIVKGNSISELKAMFNDNVTYNVNSSYESRTISRVEKKKKDNETTDIQAEILWFDNIPLKYIKFPGSKDNNG